MGRKADLIYEIKRAAGLIAAWATELEDIHG